MDYTIMQSNAGLRAYARTQLAGKWFASAIVTLVYMLIFYIANVLVSGIGAFIGFVFEFQNTDILSIFIKTVVSSAITGPVTVGYFWYFMYIARGEPTALQNLFDGFRLFSKVFLVFFTQTLLIMLWTLLLFVPGIIKGCSYAMTFFILRDNPDIGTLEAITQSRRMMNGHKMRYFLLQLSFMGWLLLCIISAGIGLLWLLPYAYLTTANFYEYLKQNRAS
ncbi:MAG: DUF975 family protein [Spirochaetaceae bacterium]|jgi:uncharacterized membrane protein|nr:DUF975 family protein [Spirochaetaceae bacterium]